MQKPASMEAGWTGYLKIALIVLAAALAASLLTVWLVKIFLFPNEFKPVRLSEGEARTLDAKIDALTSPPASPERPLSRKGPIGEETLTPERYEEIPEKREIHLTERELNALLARNTDLARKLAIDLSNDLASAKLLLPLDPELPLLGGKTLKVTAGLELRYAAGKPVVILRGVSIWGVPLPNAWLGGLKNIDLVQTFGARNGFWNTFAAGVEEIHLVEGHLTIKLKE